MSHRTAHDIKVPVAPLVDVIEGRGGLLALTAANGIAYGSARQERYERAYHRARRAGVVSAHVADHLACELLQLHPSSVWGDVWWAAGSSEQAPPPPREVAA